ncbi:MAG: RpiB/LacA/LacB family sugar-phosphate isomerase [Candidatus Brennerbacteria bacterium]|nr:RpiB/LacA/LacB family sugar-phosphate isomerase [Candidatus Brennerbacteria bacterium]
MIIYIASDHRGFQLKEALKNFLKANGYTVEDLGNSRLDKEDDYPDFAAKVAKIISEDYYNERRGIVLCGSGVGVDIVVNKFPRVRSVLAISPDQASVSRNDDDTNVLSLAADFMEEEKVKKIVSVWLQTPFAGEAKNKRRLDKIAEIEKTINI